jgi:membrane associated rhomboid family serine protease
MSPSARSYGFRTNWKGFVTPAIKAIVLLCTGVFLAQTLVELFFPPAVTGYVNHVLGLAPYYVTHRGWIWQPLTYIFLHGGLLHLLLNMLFLWMFGVDLERAWGTRRFWNYFLVTGIGAGIVTILVKTALDPHGFLGTSLVPTIGASGAIYAVLVAAAIMFPRSAGVADSVSGANSHAHLCDGRCGHRIFRHAGAGRRQRQPRHASGRNFGGLHLSAPRIVYVSRAQRLSRLEAQTRAAQV